ncbi:ketosteroid isomerase [Mesorhizobium soli]|uniref:Ketosteroid isomerase n=2 Tax=Pseudaminobacter soli (ex Li et al. 2025) TaxID=1295366 RepID=A0A2P7SD97_9HYPH|nr:ketosteroid isomerase [Mesorhizobium soli]
MGGTSAAELVKALLAAYAAKDRDAAERLISADFHFSSPLDNRIDRETYFTICWPNSKLIEGFEIEHLFADEDKAAVTYVGRSLSGKRFRNTEVFMCRDGQITDVEVYFGWWVPHEVPLGHHVDQR